MRCDVMGGGVAGVKPFSVSGNRVHGDRYVLFNTGRPSLKN